MGRVSQKLHSIGIPLWYDHGIPYGFDWEKKISEKVKDAQAVVLFFTKGILLKDRSYVRIEYLMATEYFNKKVYVVMMDHINKEEIPFDKVPWWINIQTKQNINVADIDDPDAIALKVAEAMGAIVPVKRPQLLHNSLEYNTPDNVSATEELIRHQGKEFTSTDCMKLRREHSWGDKFIIPDEYKIIAPNAFTLVIGIKSIYIPQTIEHIDESFFEYPGTAKVIFIHKQNKRYGIAKGGLCVADNFTGKTFPVKRGVLLKYYGK